MKTLKIAIFELKKMIRDWRWIVFFFLQPILATLLLGLAAYNHPKDMKVALFNQSPNQYSKQIEDEIIKTAELKVSVLENETAVRENLTKDLSSLGVILNIEDISGKAEGKIDIIENVVAPQISSEAKLKVVDSTENTIKIFVKDNSFEDVEEIVSSQSRKKREDADASILELKNKISELPLPANILDELKTSVDKVKVDTEIKTDDIIIDADPIKVSSEENSHEELKFFDYYAPAVIILLIIFIGMNQTSTSITQEREAGTFERFFATPYTKMQMVFGKMTAYMSLSIVLAIIVISILSLVFKSSLGPLWLVGLVTFMTGLTAIALGLFISALTYNVFESVNASVLVFFIILILTTLIFQPETMHPFAKFLSDLFPFTYSIKIMREVNLLKLGFFDVWKGLAINAAYLFGLLFLSAILLRRRSN